MVFLRKLICGLGLFLLAFTVKAAPPQYAFRISFSDKLGAPQLSAQPAWLSSRAMARRAHFNISLDSTDRPVSPLYVDTMLQLTSGVLHTTSRWLNNCVILVTDSTGIAAIRSRPYVRSVEWVGYFSQGLHQRMAQSGPDLPYGAEPKETGSSSFYGTTWAQTNLVHGDALHDRGFRGAGKLIVVMDAGFQYVDFHPGFADLRNSGRILETYNIRQKSSGVYASDVHGMQCLSTISGYDPGNFVGSAPDAEVALYATEDASVTDAIYELDNLIAGMERADSLGADVLCASIVYNIFYSPYYYSFARTDLDGHSTNVSQAVNMAVAKGIFYVSSAGNEGGNSWNYLDSPGDADSSLTIGSVNYNKIASGFSSPGPNASGRIKPDLCFLGEPTAVFSGVSGTTYSSGTSFAAPQAAGYAACLLQAFPQASLYQIRQAMIRSADIYSNPTAKKGYGVPDFRLVIDDLVGVDGVSGKEELKVSPNPFFDRLQVHLPVNSKRIDCRMFDMLGRSVSINVQRSGSVISIKPVSIPPTGVYVLTVNVDGAQRAIRVIHE